MTAETGATDKEKEVDEEKPVVDPETAAEADPNGAAVNNKAVAYDDGDLDSVDDDEEEARTRLENFKYYTSLTLGTLCIVSIFAFLFLVPFVLDPAVSTLLHEFVDEPATCRVNSVRITHGKSNCTESWSSCREGCTSTQYMCYQVRVQYSPQAHVNGTTVNEVFDWVSLTRFDDKENATLEDTPLLINIKGCGYPPNVDCAEFTIKYENISKTGQTFPCYYSRINPWIVLETYSFAESTTEIVASIAIPNGLFLISLIVLLYWYCPYCQARCKKYEEQMDEEEEAGKEQQLATIEAKDFNNGM